MDGEPRRLAFPFFAVLCLTRRRCFPRRVLAGDGDEASVSVSVSVRGEAGGVSRPRLRRSAGVRSAVPMSAAGMGVVECGLTEAAAGRAGDASASSGPIGGQVAGRVEIVVVTEL